MKTIFTNLIRCLMVVAFCVLSIRSIAQTKFIGVNEYNGNSNNFGNIFSINTDGTGYHVDFPLPTTSNTGKSPYGTPVSYNGKLYGLTSAGGDSNGGVLFEYDPATGTYIVKYSFKYNDALAKGSLVVYNNKLYGTTLYGGANDFGMVFSYDPAQTGDAGFVDLYDFNDTNGENPCTTLTLFNNKLYGTTILGGNNGFGTIFSFDPTQTTSAGFTKLYDFVTSVGEVAPGSLTVYNNILYGAVSGGGNAGAGFIYSVDPSQTGSGAFNELYDFDGATNGSNPTGSLMLYNNKLYGLTNFGGNTNVGTIFSYDPSQTGAAGFAKIYDFAGSTGSKPTLGYLTAFNGLLYGMTSSGTGQANSGVFFSYDPTKTGSPGYTRIFNFGTKGDFGPNGSLLVYNNLLYGFTRTGGSQNGSGALFSFDPSNAAYTELFSFSAQPTDKGPQSVVNINGKIYGITVLGASQSLFTYDPATTQFKHLYNFDGSSNLVGNLVANQNILYGSDQSKGVFSYNTATQQYSSVTPLTGRYNGDLVWNNGKIYGSASSGGANNLGFVFSYDPGTQTYTDLFDCTSNIQISRFAVAIDNKLYGYYNGGNYGTAATIAPYIISFDVTTNAATHEYDFTKDATSGNWGVPNGYWAVVNNVIYGTTYQDGAFNDGVIFSYEPQAKIYTKLYDLSSTTGYTSFILDNPKFIAYNNKVFGVFKGQYSANITDGSAFISFDPAVPNSLTSITSGLNNPADFLLYTPPVPQTITFADLTKTYGDADFAPGATSDNPAIPITYTSDNANVATITTDGKIHIVAAGTANITASQVADDTHLAASVTKVLTVNKATPVITFTNDITATYGDADAALPATSNNATATTPVTYALSNQKDASGNPATIANITTDGKLQILMPGTATITASQAGSDNYNAATDVAKNLTINKKQLTVKASDATKTFGTANPAFTTTYQGLVNDGDASLITGTATVNVSDPNNGGADPGVNAPVGTYNLVPDVSGLSSNYYTFTPANGILTVTQAVQVVTVTNVPANPTYGDSPAPITVSSPGTGDISVSSDNENVATVTKDGSGNYTLNVKGAGTANITFSQAADANHDAGTTTQTITVAKKALTSVVVDDKSILAGQPLPAFTATFNGLITGDDAATAITPAPAFSTTAANTNTAGTYDINIDNYSSLTSNNYTLPADYTKGKLTIGSIAFNNITKTYGDAAFDPGATSSESGTPTYTIANTNVAAYDASTGLVTIKGAGTTNITATINGSSVTRTLTVNQKTVNVTADNASKTYGDANPAIAIHYSGFVNGENETTITPFTPATASTGVTTGSNAGTYNITLSGASAANYSFTYATGATLTVNKAALTVSADNQTKVYGQANPALTLTYTGFVNGDDQTKLNPQPTASTTATASSGAGTYPITLGTVTATNYTVTTNNGTLTITPAALTVTANSFTRDRGQPNPAFTVNYAGFVNGDTQSNLTTPATATTTATPSSPAGIYPIVPAGAASNNYTFNYVNGTLTVNGNQLITFNPLSVMTYGDADFDPMATSDQGVTPTYTTSNPSVATIVGGKVHIAGAGTADITATFAGNGTYQQTTAKQTLTVQPHHLTIQANDAIKAQGQPNPVFTATYNGFVNGDTYLSLQTQPNITTTATTTSPAGTYPITVSGAQAFNNNYTIGYANGTLTVSAMRNITFAALPAKTYGDADFSAGITSATNETIQYSSSNPNVAVINNGNVHIVGAGTTTLTATLPANAYYPTPTTVSQIFTVNQATLIATADNKTKIYLQQNPPLTISYQGFVNGENSTILSSQPTASTLATTSSYPGTYAISVSGGTAANYKFQYQNGTLTVAPQGGADISSMFAKMSSRSQLDVNVYLLDQQPVNLMLYDIGGRLLNSQRPPLYKGFNTYTFDVSMLPVGTYIVKAVANGLNMSQKILVH